MLGYISSTRKKSCQACVKAKRRCDLGYPLCKRCLSKGLDCRYPNANAKLREAEVVVRQTTPDLIVPVVTGQFADNLLTGPTELDLDLALPQDPVSTLNLDPALFHYVEVSSSDSSSPDVTSYDELDFVLLDSLLPQIWEPRMVNQNQLSAVVNTLCSLISTMAFTGHTFFINPSLYDHHQPQAYQDAVSLCALYLLKTDNNKAILASSIDAKITHLIATYNSWTFSDHLAAVQALILYQIMRLYDTSLAQQAVAAKQNALLEHWTTSLWKRSVNSSSHSLPSYSTWVFQESLRRTVLMATFVRCSWSAATKGGIAELVPVLARLPLTRDQRLWESKEQEWEGLGLGIVAQKSLVAYGDFSLGWCPDVDRVEGLTELDRLLLVACRGGDDPRLLAV
jgi:hypothetical protein